MIVLHAAAVYVGLGLAVAAAFVVAGVTRVQPQPVTIGARILLFPASVALWPYILVRWIGAGRQ